VFDEGRGRFTICTTAIGGFVNNTKSGSYWGEGNPVLHQELCSFMGVYPSSSCLHQAFSRPSLSSLSACNTLSLRHSQNNRPLRPLWPQGPSILATTQPWGITLQINKCLATRLKSILSFKGSCYSSFGGRNSPPQSQWLQNLMPNLQ